MALKLLFFCCKIVKIALRPEDFNNFAAKNSNFIAILITFCTFRSHLNN